MLETHRVEIKLGSSYPRTMPEIRWITPIYHPNISEIGMVCLGGYGTHWVPSVQLDELCIMLWDMARYHNYDIRSPYNREAALWVANQTAILFPTDSRPLRDIRAALGRISPQDEALSQRSQASGACATNGTQKNTQRRRPDDSTTPAARVRQFIDRYRRVFVQGGNNLPERIDLNPEPSNLELQALATAVAASTRLVDEDDTEEFVVLDSNDAAAPSQQPTQPDSNEIVFIE
jgi:hypothetical protein